MGTEKWANEQCLFDHIWSYLIIFAHLNNKWIKNEQKPTKTSKNKQKWTENEQINQYWTPEQISNNSVHFLFIPSIWTTIERLF